MGKRIYGLLLMVALVMPYPAAARVGLPVGAVANDYDAAVPMAWMQLSFQLIRQTPGYSPPVAARTFGYMGVALYEAVVPGMPGYQSLAGQLQDLNGLPKTAVGAALQPTWGQNRPFALTSGKVCGAPPPPHFSTAKDSPFYQSALEVYTTVKNLTAEQKEITLFWDDAPITTATPPGHSLAIATQLLQQEDDSLALAALTYAQVGIAVNDAFISA